MPTYDYKCMGCGNVFEHFQSMTSEPLKYCKKCGGDLKRLIGTGIGPIFKGSGFYETDYKSKGNISKQSSSNPGEGKKKETPAAKKAEPQ
jgi:putative FmdB family regulatory protein